VQNLKNFFEFPQIIFSERFTLGFIDCSARDAGHKMRQDTKSSKTVIMRLKEYSNASSMDSPASTRSAALAVLVPLRNPKTGECQQDDTP
jgi:hypothetical protein